METFSAPIIDQPEQEDTIAARLVTLTQASSADDFGLFADYMRRQEGREISDHIESSNVLAAEMIRRNRDAYAWLKLIDRPNNIPTTLVPMIAVKMFDYTTPQHPWSNEPDDYVWGAEIAVNNPLPGISTVAIEARGRIVATRALQQGDILWMTESGSSDHDQPKLTAQTVAGISEATRVLVTAADGRVYAASIPNMEPDGNYGYAVERFVTLERQAPQK